MLYQIVMARYDWLGSNHLYNVGVGLALSWALATVAALSKRRWVRLLCLIVPLLLLLAQLALHLLFGQTVNPATVRMLVETTSREAAEFCAGYLLSWQFMVCVP